MRIRTIKPEFWTNEKMAKLPDFARLLAIGLLNFADDHGYFWANPLLIRGALFPFDDDSSKVRRSVEQLATEGFLRLGKTPDGRECGHIVNFSKHQRVDKPKDSEIQPLISFDDQSKNDLGLIQDESPLEGKGREGKGKDPSRTPPAPVGGDEKEPDPRHGQITKRWGELFAGAFSGESYAFSGHDASALKRFLRTSKDSAEEFLTVAVRAWERRKQDRFAAYCKNAATIHGLCTCYNQIRVELQSPAGGAAAPAAPPPRPTIYDEPPGWREKAKKLWPEMEITEAWNDLSATVRNALLQA